MKRTAGAFLMAAALGGCMSVERGPETAGPVCSGGCGRGYAPAAIPGAQGAWGQEVPVAGPYAPPMNPQAAQYMMNQSVPLSPAQLTALAGGRNPSGIVQASANVPNLPVPPGGMMAPPGMPGMPGMPPGMMPPGAGGMPGRGPGNMMAAFGPPPPPGAFPGVGPKRFAVARTQVRFGRPSGMRISWSSVGADGKPSYPATPLEVPGRYNFLQAAVYRLKLSGIEGRPGLELYPTLEVVPTNPKTEAFLAHNAVPVEFTADDFQQVSEGNYLVKVIYLPDPQFQELAATGTDEIVSTRLEPGADPIKEALRRGSILLVIRMGNMDQEAPNTPPIDAPPPGGAPQGPPPGMPMFAPGMGHAGPAGMVPYGPNGPMFVPMPGMGPGGPGGPGGMGMMMGAGPMGGPMGGPMSGPMSGPMGPMGAMGPMGGPMNPMMAPPGMGMGPMGPMGPMGGQPTGIPAPPAPGAPPGRSMSPLPPSVAPTPVAKAPESSAVRLASATGPLPTSLPSTLTGPRVASNTPLPTPGSLTIPDAGSKR